MGGAGLECLELPFSIPDNLFGKFWPKAFRHRDEAVERVVFSEDEGRVRPCRFIETACGRTAEQPDSTHFIESEKGYGSTAGSRPLLKMSLLHLLDLG